MNKKSIDIGETNPFRIPADETVANTSGSSNANSDALRTDMLPGSQALPARVRLSHQINFKILIGIFFGLLIIGFIVYFMTGYGRPRLENTIISLIGAENVSSQQILSTHSKTTENSPESSKTPKPSHTSKPTLTKVSLLGIQKSNTPTSTATYKPTQTSTASLTPTPACWDVSSISLADVGQTRCVRGTILETIEKTTNFLVIFSHQKGALYWITYDMVWSAGDDGVCYQTTGQIDDLGGNPVLVFDYSNIPIVCP